MGCEGHGCVPQCKGMKLIALGIILFVNESYLRFNWWYLFSGLLVLKGLMVILMHGCMCQRMMHGKEECCGSSCCQEEKPAEAESEAKVAAAKPAKPKKGK